MEENCRPGYRFTESMEVTGADERVKKFRKAYLEGKLVVDSERVAEKLMAFEKALSPVLPKPDL